MSVRGYLLIEAEAGQPKAVAVAIAKLELSDARIINVDTVAGPFDIVVLVEAGDLDPLARCVNAIHRLPGVRRTMTCLAF